MLEKKLLNTLSHMDDMLKGCFIEDYMEKVKQERNCTIEEYINRLIKEIPVMREETAEENVYLYDWLENELNKIK